MVAPGSRASISSATIAVVSEPDRSWAFSSTRKTRSASPSKARPTSAPVARTRAWRSRWFSGWIGSAGWLGKVPSSSGVEDLELERQGLEHGGHDEAPHPVGRVGHDLERPQAVEVDEGPDVVGETGQHLVRVAGAGGGGRRDAGLGPAADVGQAGVLADGSGAGATELDAVVGRRVVGGGEHGPGRVEGTGGEVEHVGRSRGRGRRRRGPGWSLRRRRRPPGRGRWGACPGRPGPARPRRPRTRRRRRRHRRLHTGRRRAARAPGRGCRRP